MTSRSLHILLISDATGSTLAAAIKAVLSQFPDHDTTVSMHPFLRTTEDLDTIPQREFDRASAVVFTLVSQSLKDAVLHRAAATGLPVISLLDPVTDLVAKLLGTPPTSMPGGQYTVDDRYMTQIAAMDFAISNDDGAILDRLLSADVVLTGVSRTSKTPTCIYLGYQGIRAANVPLVPGQETYPELQEARAAGIPVIGLTASATRLRQVRKTRLRSMGSTDRLDYTGLAEIEEELVRARLYFDKLGIPVIDVTRRSIEETAASIRRLLEHPGEAP